MGHQLHLPRESGGTNPTEPPGWRWRRRFDSPWWLVVGALGLVGMGVWAGYEAFVTRRIERTGVTTQGVVKRAWIHVDETQRTPQPHYWLEVRFSLDRPAEAPGPEQGSPAASSSGPANQTGSKEVDWRFYYQKQAGATVTIKYLPSNPARFEIMGAGMGSIHWAWQVAFLALAAATVVLVFSNSIERRSR